MNRFQLFTDGEEKLYLEATLEEGAIIIRNTTTESIRAIPKT